MGDGIEDDNHSVVIFASPIDTETGALTGNRLRIEGSGGGFAETPEDLTGVVIKLGHVLFEPDAFRGLKADGFEFGGVNEGIIKGGVLEATPCCAAAGIHEAFPEPVFAVGRTEQEGMAFAFEEHGADDLRPDGRLHESGFIQDDEIQTRAAQVIGRMGAFDGDPTAAGKIQTAGGFADGDFQITAGQFEVTPDMIGHVIGGGEPPAGFAISNGFENSAFADFGFTETTATSDDFKTGFALQNDFLVGMRFGQMDVCLFLLHFRHPLLLRHSQVQRVCRMVRHQPQGAGRRVWRCGR